MKRLLALAAVATLAAGGLALSDVTPAGAGTTNLGTLSATPATTLVGQAVTVSAGTPCPDVSTTVQVTYSLGNGDFVDGVSVTVNPDGTWSDVVTMDHAGHYFVDARCEHQNAAPNAGHLAVHGLTTIDGTYTGTDFQVNGTVTATPSPATSNQTVAFTAGPGSTCAPPTGEVKLTIKDPDGIAVVTDATPTVATDGTFTLQQALAKVGTYTVTGTCHRVLDVPKLNAGHLAVAQAQPTNDFTYTGTAVVAAAPTTTTTAPPAAAAEAVTAAPTFTG